MGLVFQKCFKMKALCLLILSAIVNCSVGYTIVERPVDEKEFSYNQIPSGVVQSRPPTGFWFQQHPYNLPKSEPQALFELYYLIQVITIYRRNHPRAHRSHLDALVEELQDDGFQQKIRQALQGIKELDVLKAYADLNLQDYAPFVNDRRQLIPAIHRTLNEIQLGQIEDKELRWTLERLKEESSALTVKMARKEAEVLKELIESNRKFEKAWTVSDILAAVFGKQDVDTMKDFEQKYEVVDDGKPIDDGKVEEFWVVFEDDKREVSTTGSPSSTTSAEPETKPFQFVDDNYEQYEAKQEVEVDAKEEEVEQSSEPKEVNETFTVEEVEQNLEHDSESKEEVEAIAEEEVVDDTLEQDTYVEREDIVAEEETIEESLEQESTVDLDGEQRIKTDGFEFKEENYERSDLEEEVERTVPEENDQGLVEEVVAEEELPDQAPEELQTLDASAEVVEEPEPEYTEDVGEELQNLEDSAKIEKQPEPAFTEDIEEDLQNPDGPIETEEQLESDFTEEIIEELQSLDGSLEVAEISEPADEEVDGNPQILDEVQPDLTEELVEEIPEPAAAKASPDSITFPVDPKWVEDSVRPLASSEATGLDSVHNPEEVEAPVAQSVPLWISKGYSAEYEGREVVEEEEVQESEVDTNDLESRAEPTEKAEIDQETLRYVAFEILKVVSLLEDNAGFTGLRDQITNEDVDRLIEQLSVEQFVSLIDEQGINRVEMINALERLILEKNLESSREILEVLEQWKQGENVQQVENGYFSESYGKDGEDEVESRILDEEEIATSEDVQDLEPLVDESENDAESQVEDSDNNAEEVGPELKSNDLDEAEPVDDGYFSENYGKAEGDVDGIEGRMLDIDEVATSEEAQEQLVDELESEAELQVADLQDAVEEIEPESEGVQELKSNDLVEEAEAEQIDDGYFSEKYGESEVEAESRTLEDDQETVEQSELVVATPDEAQDAEQLVDELEGKLKDDAELQVEDSDTVDEISVETESVQELKSGDPVEDAELLNDSPELLEDASDLSESISQVENLEESSNVPISKDFQPFPEEVTEDTEPLENARRVVEQKKLQPFPEEVTEETVPVNSKILEPFPDQILNEAQPLEVALDQLDPFPDQILNETQTLEIASQNQESDSSVDDVKIVPVSNRPFPATSTGGSEHLEVARAGTDEGALADEDRREEILEDLHPEP